MTWIRRARIITYQWVCSITEEIAHKEFPRPETHFNKSLVLWFKTSKVINKVKDTASTLLQLKVILQRRHVLDNTWNFSTKGYSWAKWAVYRISWTGTRRRGKAAITEARWEAKSQRRDSFSYLGELGTPLRLRSKSSDGQGKLQQADPQEANKGKLQLKCPEAPPSLTGASYPVDYNLSWQSEGPVIFVSYTIPISYDLP